MASFALPLVGPGLAVDLRRAFDLSQRVAPALSSPSRAFGLPPPTGGPVALGPFVGDVRRGGSCNCETYTITPHGDGTHTEGVGHILADRVAVIDLVDDALLPALVVTVVPARLENVDDAVAGNHAPDDLVVDELSLQEAIDFTAVPRGFTPAALVIRTAPGRDRRRAQFSGQNPPYLTVDAAALVRTRGFTHLLVDLPSLDREDDGGLLGAHHAFFDVPARVTHMHGGAAPTRRTVTELIAVDDDVKDGAYALSLQLAPLVADAVPSRPLLFPLVAASPSWLRSS